MLIGIFNKIVAICLPFVIGFAIAYAVNPLVSKLRDKNIPKGFAIAIVLFVLCILIFFMGYVISTTCVSQITNLLDSINAFISKIAAYSDKINIGALQKTLNDNSNEILSNLTKYVSDGAINIVLSSIDLIGDFLIGAAAFIYFLIDMDKIRDNIKMFFKNVIKERISFYLY